MVSKSRGHVQVLSSFPKELQDEDTTLQRGRASVWGSRVTKSVAGRVRANRSTVLGCIFALLHL